MGEVWRATDTTLNREVAIKVLPAAFSADPDRLTRFAREVRATIAGAMLGTAGSLGRLHLQRIGTEPRPFHKEN
jgi:serine/threonine-protein kinase